MEFDEDGNVEYKEKVVGVIPESCNPKIVHNDEHDKDYLEVDGLIYEDYTHAAEILREKGECNVSVEISVDSLSFDAKTKIMNIDSFHFLGVTILGVTTDDSHQEIDPGMEGANITISDFSAENNSFVFNKKDLIEEITAEVLSRLDYKSADFSANYTDGKEESGLDKEKLTFEETEVKTTEEATTETPEVVEDETFEEEAETKTEEAAEEFEEATEEESETEKVNDETEDEVTEDESAEEVNDLPFEETEETDSEEETEEDHQSVSAIEDEDSTGTKLENSLNYSVTINGITKEFAVSLQDKINSIAILVNETYGESDCTFYDVDVYEDDGKYCVMHDWWNNKHYRQEYSVKKDVYSLKGDRVPVFMQFLTQDQINQLDKMKSDFAAIESELNTYKSKELHAAREEVLNCEEYSVMADFAEFKELKDNMDEYSVEDLANKADLVYAKFMKSNYSTFSANNGKDKKRGMVFMTSGSSEEEKLPYGGLFKNFKGKK